MYDIYDACKAHPLSEAEKEELRKDVFPPAEKEIEVVWKKDKTGTSEMERVILEKLPQDTEYRRIVIELDSGYEWGSGMLPAARERFHREMRTLFIEAGWEYVAPAFDNGVSDYGWHFAFGHDVSCFSACKARSVAAAYRR